jgi:hypothetical protein
MEGLDDATNWDNGKFLDEQRSQRAMCNAPLSCVLLLLPPPLRKHSRQQHSQGVCGETNSPAVLVPASHAAHCTRQGAAAVSSKASI